MTSIYKGIPKEKQTAYQRWEMASFDEDKKSVVEEQKRAQQEIVAAIQEATSEDMKALLVNMRNDAKEEGFKAGREEGFAVGQEEGLAKGYGEGLARGFEEGLAKGHEEGFAKGLEEGRLQGAEEATQMQALAREFVDEITHANENIAGDILKLSLDIAKAMLKTALPVRPELVLPIVTEAIRYLPSVQQPALLFLDPADAVIVRAAMKEELAAAGWRVIEEKMERGSCRVETATNQIDCSLSTRWHRIISAFGQSSEWMEQP